MRIFVVLLLAFSFVGCARVANRASIFRTYQPSINEMTQTTLIDAKQRALFSAPANPDQYPSRQYFICAEPSPDAVSALSSAFSASFTIDSRTSGTLAKALSEAVGKLGKRNATIQLLRDSLYRQCEAYMNGMIDREDYVDISGRYVDAMVTLLAIEQVTSPNAGDGQLILRSGAVSADADLANNRPVGGTNARAPSDGKEAGNPSSSPSPSEPKPNSLSDAEATPAKEPDNSSSSIESELEAGATVKIDSGVVNAGGSPINQSRPVNHVAKEVTTMLRIFLEKNTQDRCLQRVEKILDAREGRIGRTRDSEDSQDFYTDQGYRRRRDRKEMIQSYLRLCQLVFSGNDSLSSMVPPGE